MFLQQPGPAITIEKVAAKMLPAEFIGLGDIPLREHGPLQIGAQIILQSEKYGRRKHSSTRLEIGIDRSRVRRVLLPVGKFVTVCAKEKVHVVEVSGVRSVLQI